MTTTKLPVIGISGKTSSAHALRGVVNKISALFSITATPPSAPTAAAAEQRPPLEICVLVDVSGSMAGAKLKYAKRACKKVIKHLMPGGDAIHLIVYDDRAKVVFAGGDLKEKESLKQKVRVLRDGGSTNIEAGLQSAFAVFREHAASGAAAAAAGPRRVKRILLFSDGEATDGAKSASQLRKIASDGYEASGGEVSVSTFGIGDGFKEDVMKEISEGGHGSYFFIRAAEDIARTMSKAIHGMLDLAGLNSKLHLRGINGAVVSRIFGKETETALIDGAPVGDILVDSTKQVLAEVELGSAVVGAPVPVVPIIAYRLVFQLPAAAGAAKEESISGEVSIALTDDASLVKQREPAVVVATAIQQAALANRSIAELLSRRKKEEAIDLKRRSIAQLEEVLALDASGRVSEVLRKANRALETMVHSGPDLSRARKEAHAEAVMEEEDDEAGYLSRSDSDSGHYSDEGPAELGSEGSLESGSPFEEDDDGYLS